jgi:hypothetical protein
MMEVELGVRVLDMVKRAVVEYNVDSIVDSLNEDERLHSV